MPNSIVATVKPEIKLKNKTKTNYEQNLQKDMDLSKEKKS